MIESATSTYLGRFGFYAAVVLLASLVGAQFPQATTMGRTWTGF